MVNVISVGPSQDDVFTQIGTVLDAVLSGVRNFQGEQNRTPEPADSDFVVMWLLNAPRLSTNVTTYAQSLFTASISGTTMIVTTVQSPASGAIGQGSIGSFSVGVVPPPAILIGALVFGPSVADGTKVVDGPGGVGTYTVSPAQDVASEVMAAGTVELEQSAEFVVQMDVHGPNAYANASAITTVFRDEKGVAAFEEAGGPATPLLADDPKQVPFVNDQQQIEYRLIVEARLQVNPTVVMSQDFADQLAVMTHAATAIGT